MPLDPEMIEQLVPDGEPPRELITELARGLARRLVEQPLLYRSYLWASALLNQLFRYSTELLPSRFVHASAGFIQLNPRVGLDYRSDAFGVYLLAGGNEGEQTVEFLHIGSLIFPVVINFGQVQLHGCPPNPPNASATCWVQNVGSYNSWQRGILTCRHAVKALSKGNSVALIPSNHHSQPSSSVLVEIDECTIDAAVLEIRAADWPSGLNRLHVSNPSAPGQPVQFEDRNGNFQTGHVLRVFNYPTYYGNLFGQRVIGDCKGVAGDSGSLLTDLKTNKAVGIYMGDIPDGTGGRDGIFQDLSQVEAYFKLAFYY